MALILHIIEIGSFSFRHHHYLMFEFTANDIAELMQRHRDELLRFLSKRVNCSDVALDIFQDTFIRYAGYRNKGSVDNPRAFIFKIAANLATDYLRSRSRQLKHVTGQDVLPEAFEDAKPSLERTVISEQQLEHVIEALSELPPKCRTVFILLKFKHYSYAQVEQQLGISQTMILRYLNRALTHCRTRLQDFE